MVPIPDSVQLTALVFCWIGVGTYFSFEYFILKSDEEVTMERLRLMHAFGLLGPLVPLITGALGFFSKNKNAVH